VFRRSLSLAAVLLIGCTACSVDVTAGGTLDAGEVATQAEDALEKEVGARPDITCPEDLKAEVGAETHCVLTGGGDPTEYDVLVRVNAVDGDTATFDVEVGDKPLN
jgi:hypothetical protein